MRLLAVGEEYPGSLPAGGADGGGVLELVGGALQLTVLMPKPNAAENAALAAGFSSYSLYVSPVPPHVAIWVWKYPAPVGYMETPFHAGIYGGEDLRVSEYLAVGEPAENNALMVVVLDGRKILRLRMCGLMHGAVAAFYAAIARQCELGPLSLEEYREALQRVYNRLTSREIFERGVSWKHRAEE